MSKGDKVRGNKVNGTVKDKVKGTVKDKVKGTVKDKVKGTVKDKVKGTVKDKVKGTVKDKVKDTARSKYWFFGALLANTLLLVTALRMLPSEGFYTSLFFTLLGLLFLLILLVGRTQQKHLLYPIHTAVCTLFILDMFGIVQGVFEAAGGIDVFFGIDWWFHFVGGLFAALYFLALTHESVVQYSTGKGVESRPEEIRASWSAFWVLFVWGAAVAISVGAFWELAEAIGWALSQHPGFAMYAADILGDLFADSLGAILASGIFSWLLLRPK